MSRHHGACLLRRSLVMGALSSGSFEAVKHATGWAYVLDPGERLPVPRIRTYFCFMVVPPIVLGVVVLACQAALIVRFGGPEKFTPWLDIVSLALLIVGTEVGI